jgi:alkylation response protein AidB-like acyl-CoA dehydrogenase
VDFELSDDQRAILQAVGSLLEQHAGAARAVELNAKGEMDGALDGALVQSGFLDVARSDGGSFLDAALVVEAVSKAGGVANAGAAALVAPGVLSASGAHDPTERTLPGPIALAKSGETGPIRYAAHARTLLVLDGEEARVVALEQGDAEPVTSNFGFPMGRVAVAVGRGDSLGAGSGAALCNWWRVAIAAETVGAMQAALDVTVAYVTRRRQFGRAIGSFQAVQHRLATLAVLIEGSRWLTYEAAYAGAPAEAAANAAAHASAAAGQVFAETQQLTGAMGYTREHDLHVWSMRLPALRLELGGVGRHRRAIAGARYKGSAPWNAG